jgi:hypothetical protein
MSGEQRQPIQCIDYQFDGSATTQHQQGIPHHRRESEQNHNIPPKDIVEKIFRECGKKYKHNQSLYNHKKKCEFKVITNKTEATNCQVILQNNVDQNMIMKLISENNDIKNLLLIQQQQLLEQQKQLGEQHRQLVEIVPITHNNTFLVIGSITNVLLKDGLVQQDGFIDANKAQTLTSLGLDGYYSTEPIARFEYAKPGKELKKIS